MIDDITYNQVICLNKTSLSFNNVIRSFSEKRKLILILENSKKIIIPGNSIDTTGYKKRILELIVMAQDKGLEIREKSVKHYAQVKDDEYVLVRW